jgi:hypothetical protein
VTDDELTDAWEAVLDRSITHDEHLRIAFTLIRRWGQEEAERRLLSGTRANCEAMEAADRFDADLTARWADRIATCVGVHDEWASYDDFIARYPELQRSDLLGLPEWKRRAR